MIEIIRSIFLVGCLKRRAYALIFGSRLFGIIVCVGTTFNKLKCRTIGYCALNVNVNRDQKIESDFETCDRISMKRTHFKSSIFKILFKSPK